MRYLYINNKNELFVCGYKTPVDINSRIIIHINTAAVITGTVVSKRNGVKLIDWDILNSESLFKDLIANGDIE